MAAWPGGRKLKNDFGRVIKVPQKAFRVSPVLAGVRLADELPMQDKPSNRLHEHEPVDVDRFARYGQV